MKKHSFQNGKWEWILLDIEHVQQTNTKLNLPDVCKDWMELLQSNVNSNLQMNTFEHGNESIWGSIIYHQSIEKHSKQNILQYYLSKGTLITSLIDISLLHKLEEEQLIKRMEQAENAIEGFMILIGEIIASFLEDIQLFENRIHELLWHIKEVNDEDVLERIISNRHEILVWKNLLIPIIEIREVIKETFGDEVTNFTHFNRTSKRITRCHQIIGEYNDEIGELIELENIISSHRGNEIVKTLTVITILFAPIATWSALWGMNFKVMPELKWKYGYPLSIIVILLSTLGLFYFLKKKNWIGNILSVNKNKKF